MLTPDQLEQYRASGFILLRGVIPASSVHGMREQIAALVDRSARGEGPEIAWIDRGLRLPERLGQLLRPGWIQPAFIDSIEEGPFLSAAEKVLNSPVRYSLFGMLAGGNGKPYIQSWHRDLGPIEGPEQMPILERNFRLLCQVNAPLVADRYLQIVPGSHLRPTTQQEREVLRSSPTGDMPGQFTVECEPGDVALYYPNLLHRGYNPAGAFRWTMHHAFLRADALVSAHEYGQQSWIAAPGYLDGLPARTRAFMRGYLDALPAGEPANLAA